MLRMADLDLAGKRVLIREDLNVPIKDGQVTSDQRITAALPTIKLALKNGAALMLMSHLGRPKEGVWTEEDSLAPVAKRLSQLLGFEVPLIKDWLDGVQVAPGKVVLLENCRMNIGEAKDDEALAKKICRALRCFRYGRLRYRASRAGFYPWRDCASKNCLWRSVVNG